MYTAVQYIISYIGIHMEGDVYRTHIQWRGGVYPNGCTELASGKIHLRKIASAENYIRGKLHPLDDSVPPNGWGMCLND